MYTCTHRIDLYTQCTLVYTMYTPRSDPVHVYTQLAVIFVHNMYTYTRTSCTLVHIMYACVNSVHYVQLCAYICRMHLNTVHTIYTLCTYAMRWGYVHCDYTVAGSMCTWGFIMAFAKSCWYIFVEMYVTDASHVLTAASFDVQRFHIQDILDCIQDSIADFRFP